MNNSSSEHKRMVCEERQGESRVRENFMHGLVDEVNRKSRNLLRRRRFTLIELLVVVVIIAILAALLSGYRRIYYVGMENYDPLGAQRHVGKVPSAFIGAVEQLAPGS